MANESHPQELQRLDRKVFWQRAVLWFESLWTALAWPLNIALIFVALAASGFLPRLPQAPRLGLLIILAAAFLFALKPLLKVTWPTRFKALRHIERAAGLTHRTVSSADDTLATEFNNPATDRLWEEHKRQQLAKLKSIKLVAPRSAWRSFDPRALRVPVALLALSALLLGPGGLAGNVRNSLLLTPQAAPLPLTLDAWLKPPAYTGRPPLLLTGPQVAAKLASNELIVAPEKSVFTLRVAGARDPKLEFLALEPQGAGAEQTELEIKQQVAPGLLAAETTLLRPHVIVVRDGATELARWPVALIPDAAPTLKLSSPPSSEGLGNLVIAYEATDDYGLRKLSGELELADEQEGGTGFESDGIFLFDPPAPKFALKRPNAKEEKATQRFDLTAHPWAGFMVTLSLSVADAAGQEAAIAPTTFKLPEREFVKALPRALIEQRKQLILYPDRAFHVSQLLDNLILYPRGLVDQNGPIIAIAAISSRLRSAEGYDDVRFAINELWNVAVAIEEGALRDARAELQALRKELEKALREGASEERIAELMDKMRQAMDKLLSELQKEAERMARDGTLPRQPNQNSQSLSREDLEKMLDALEELAKGGAREQAEQLLSELDQLLQNLQPGGQQQAGEGMEGLEGMLGELGEMMRRQQELMDDTQRQHGRRDGEQLGQGQDGQELGEGPQGGGDMGPLADQQRALRRMLDELRGRGQGGSQALDDASRAMEGAEQALRDGDQEGALREQGQALENLRKGAQQLAQELRERGQGQADGRARDGEGRDGDDDPLGRPRATRQPDTGPNKDIVPSEQALRRAREILETLRAKANDRSLTDSEKAYIDRLLRGLY